MKKTMAQCTLKQGNSTTVAWLDVDKIKIGSIVTLKNEPGRWTVSEISEVRLSAEYVNERSQDYKRTRSASDI